MGQLVSWGDKKGSTGRQGIYFEASGLEAVTAVAGRLFHNGLCQGRKSICGHWCWWQCVRTYRGVFSVCEDLRAWRREEWGGR